MPLTVLIDDVRDFRDERPALVARSSQEALRSAGTQQPRPDLI